jgi:hypothetical protein
MAKEIKMDYEEYEEMLTLIKDQNEVIEKFKNAKNVVLIDNRYSTRSLFSLSVPRIAATDDLLAKEYLQNDFDLLAKSLDEAQATIKSYRNTIDDLSAPKKSWLTRNSFDL